MRKIVAPLALLASITLLTSCTKKEEVPVVPVVNQETPAPVIQDTTPINQEAPAPLPPPGPADTTLPPTVAPAVGPDGAATVTPITRTETVTYKTPAGDDPVEFSVTVTDGVITSATATPKSENEISMKRQTAFAAEVSSKVVGMKAKDLDVDAIGGSSLTTGAFEMFVRSF